MSSDTKPTFPFVSDEETVLTQKQLGQVAEPLAIHDRINTTGPLADEGGIAQPGALGRDLVTTNPNGSANQDPPIADFIEPVEFKWTEAGFEARQALKRYCEETHADY